MCGISGETLGVEEEYHLVDPSTGELASAPAQFVTSDYLQGELQRSQLEIGTPVCRTLSELRDELVNARHLASDVAGQSNSAILAAGSHPFGRWQDLQRVASSRYDTLAERFGAVTDRQNICGCHVHVGVLDLSTALAIMNRVRPYVPVLAALTSSSPFHEGADTGYASFRTMWWSMWPTAGVPPVLRSVAEYERTVADLVAGGIVDDASTLYWDVRPSMRYPTLEFRAADVCTDIDDAVLHAGLVRSLVRTLARDLASDVPELSDATIVAARWRAARYGIRGELCDPLSGAIMPAPLVIRRLLAQLEPDLRAHDEFDVIDDLMSRLLSRGTSADLQRAEFARSRDLRHVVRSAVRATRCWGSDAWPAA
jgi:carboxylate-amine ligase